MLQNSKKSLRAFMRDSAKTDEIITVPGPDSITDENGKPVMLEIKVLSNETIQKINDAYKKKAIAVDKRGQPYIANGEVAFRVERDSIKASQHIIAEALVYPDLKDPELMEFFNCSNIADMPLKVFPRADEYAHVSRAVMAALGLSSEPAQEEKESALEEVKN
ncbi:MAG: hypothetical protein LBR74_00200 [Eubacterium sp.]|jgi:hypothetical protein|nr:hypothetical protein [Eubacterium sp.]